MSKNYPTVGDHVRTRAALLARIHRLFAWHLAGKLTVHIGQRFPWRRPPTRTMRWNRGTPRTSSC